jgi:hypothetical protein
MQQTVLVLVRNTLPAGGPDFFNETDVGYSFEDAVKDIASGGVVFPTVKVLAIGGEKGFADVSREMAERLARMVEAGRFVCDDAIAFIDAMGVEIAEPGRPDRAEHSLSREQLGLVRAH